MSPNISATSMDALTALAVGARIMRVVVDLQGSDFN
jgi:hypothetical protein